MEQEKTNIKLLGKRKTLVELFGNQKFFTHFIPIVKLN